MSCFLLLLLSTRQIYSNSLISVCACVSLCEILEKNITLDQNIKETKQKRMQNYSRMSVELIVVRLDRSACRSSWSEDP